ncbi:hypothetical protein QQ045_013917 [Rhodiola kirilowii]
MAFSKSLFLVVVFLACIVPPNISARDLAESPSKAPLIGGWNSIEDVNAPEVVSVAKFAVDEHNKISNDILIFENVDIGFYRVMSSDVVQYRLIIAAAGHLSPNYLTMVQIKHDNSKELMYFYAYD